MKKMLDSQKKHLKLLIPDLEKENEISRKILNK